MMIHISKSTHFKDVDEEEGYEYIGDDYIIQVESQEFEVRKYTGEQIAFIMKPKRFDWTSPVAKALFDYLIKNLHVSKFEVYDPEVGYYRPVKLS